MSDTKKVEIGAHVFFVGRLPVTAAQDLLADLLQKVGPALATLVERFRVVEIVSTLQAGRPLSEALGGMDFSGFAPAVEKLVQAMGKKELRQIQAQALAATTCATMGGKRVWEGQAPLVDAMGMTPRQLLALTWEALDWNLGDFFNGPSESGGTSPGRAVSKE